jgi:trimethylamine--corrinoid protein Co-methyltransferase
MRHLAMTYYTIKHSSKPLMGTVYGYDKAMQSISMAAEAFGGLESVKDRPIMAAIPCTLTPLRYDESQAGAIIAYAEAGQAQLVNSLSMAGATTPVTIAGTVSVQNAEVLAGIVLAQCVRPGCPIVYSASGTNIDMRMGSLSIGSVEDAMISLVNGHLAKFYNIPCRISGALSDSKTMDSQAALESAFTLLMSQMAGGNFILHSAGIIDSYNTVSYEKLVLDNELLGMIRRLERGVAVDEENLAYEVIQEVGPQGNFLVHDHTIEHYRELYDPTIVNRQSYDDWHHDGAVSIEAVATRRWKQLLEDYDEPSLDPDVDKAMRAYLI